MLEMPSERVGVAPIGVQAASSSSGVASNTKELESPSHCKVMVPLSSSASMRVLFGFAILQWVDSGKRAAGANHPVANPREMNLVTQHKTRGCLRALINALLGVLKSFAPIALRRVSMF